MYKWIVKNSPLLISTVLVVALLAMASRGAIQSQVGLAIAGPGSSWINLQDASVGTPISTGLAAVGPYGYNGTSFDSLRTATVGNNVAATGLGIAAVYGQYNASLPTLTTALYSALQTDINGRLMFGTSTATIGSVTAIGSKTPSDGYTNPTDASDGLSFLMGWNGATWDRVATETVTNDGETPPTTGILSAEIYPMMYNGSNVDRQRGTITLGLTVGFATSTALITSPAQISCSNVSATLVASNTTTRHKVDFQSWTPANPVYICYAATCGTNIANIQLGTATSLLAYTEDRYMGAVSCITSSSTTTVAVTDR